MTHRTSDLLKRTNRVYRTEGFFYLLHLGLKFMTGLIFKYQTYFLAEHTLEQVRHLDAKNFLPKINHFDFKVIMTNQEADDLEADGFEFRSYAFLFNARKALDKGAIASCIFIGRELAHMGWVAMTQEALDSLKEPPIRVNFSKMEGYRGGVWTNPKYRKIGLHTYGNLKRHLFLANSGAIVSRFQVAKKNVAGLRGNIDFRPRIYAEGRYMKILWYRSWREKSLPL